MNKFLGLFLMLCLLAALPAAAQQPQLARKSEFLDSAYHVLPGEAGARYRRETEYTDSVGAVVKTFSLAGRRVSQQSFSNVRKGVPNGVSEWWYPDGQLRMHQEFRQGQYVGELRTYYPSGQLKRRELFSSTDAFTSAGECFAANGQPVPFTKFEQLPVYPEGDGGNRALIRAVQRGVRYPLSARKEACAGRAVVGFNVTALGEVADIRILQSLCPAVDAAVVEAVRKLKRFRPGMQDGEPVNVGFTVPITFALQ